MTPDDNTVAYPGREGAHTAAACDRLFPAARLIPHPNFSEVVEAVVSRDCTYGVLPIESSLAGPVNETHDLLYDSPLSIVAEAILPIRHCLVGLAGARLEDVREIRSHPMALDQCRALLAPPTRSNRDGRADDRLGRGERRRARRSGRSPPSPAPGRHGCTRSRCSRTTSATTSPTRALPRSRPTRASIGATASGARR